MGSETRFLFDTDFDNPQASESQARIYSEDDLAAARLEAVQMARAEFGSMEEKRAADLLAEMSAKLGSLTALRAEDVQTATESAVEIAVAMCRKMLPTLAAKHALTEIQGHITRTLIDINEEPRIVVRVSEQNVDALQPRIDSFGDGFDGKIVLLADDQLSATDCHILWADGGSERNVQRTWSEIEQAVAQIIDMDMGSLSADTEIEASEEGIVDTPDFSNSNNDLIPSSQAID